MNPGLTPLLFTGGKAQVGRQSVFCIEPWAQEYGRAQQGYWLGAPVKDLPKDRLRVLGKWVGADGRLWVSLPDDSEQDITVVAPAKHYNAGEQVTKYPTWITANEFNLETNVPEFCVGQHVTFTLDGLPTGDIVDMKGKWSLPGKYKNEKWQHMRWVTTEPISGAGYFENYGSENYRINSALLENTNQTSCWYYNTSGGKEHVSVGLNLKFNNGQQASIARNGDFTIFRPSVAMVNPTVHGTPKNMWLTGGYPNVFPASSPWTGLEAGVIGLGVAGTTNNMSYLIRVTSSNFAGEAKITQLCTINTTDYPLDINISGYLDNSDPYGSDVGNPSYARIYKNSNPQGTINQIPLDDAPQGGGFGSFHFYGSFVDYVMFRPSDDGIYVPIGKLTWGTTFSATYPSATINSNSVSGPTNPDDSDDFPVWTDTIHNSN